MKKLLVPLVMALIGIGGGVGAGLFLASPVADDMADTTCIPEDESGDHAADPLGETDNAGTADEATHDAASKEYVRMSNQFIVPVVEGGKVAALVVLSLSIEVSPGMQEAAFSAEPKLRDAFLQVLFDHANIGGFDGVFTSSTNMRALRQALRAAGQKALGPQVSDVLIVDIVRQDI